MYDPADNWTRVTENTHPQVHAAFNTLSGTHHVAYNVPHEYSYGLPSTETTLGRLAPDERVKLCHGDYDFDGSSDTLVAADILSAFLYGWPPVRVKRRRAR